MEEEDARMTGMGEDDVEELPSSEESSSSVPLAVWVPGSERSPGSGALASPLRLLPD